MFQPLSWLLLSHLELSLLNWQRQVVPVLVMGDLAALLAGRLVLSSKLVHACDAS
jgi:hypothetical protein